MKAYNYVKEFGEGIDRICNELESRGSAIPSFHTDAFILKATLKAEFVEEHIAEEGVANGEMGRTDVAVNDMAELSGRQKDILEMIGTNPSANEDDVAVNVAVNYEALGGEIGIE